MVRFIFGIFLICFSFGAIANPVVILNARAEEEARNEAIRKNLDNNKHVLDNNTIIVTLLGQSLYTIKYEGKSKRFKNRVNLEISYIISNEYLKKHDLTEFKTNNFERIKELDYKFESIESLIKYIEEMSLEINEVKSVFIRITVYENPSQIYIVETKKSK